MKGAGALAAIIGAGFLYYAAVAALIVFGWILVLLVLVPFLVFRRLRRRERPWAQ